MALFIAIKGYIPKSGLEALILSSLKKKTRKELIRGDKIIKRINDLRFRLKNKLF
jgi:hypothetical protein